MPSFLRHFSEVLPNLTEEEEEWLHKQLEAVWVFGEEEYLEEEIPEKLAGTEPDWCGMRFLRGEGDGDPPGDCEFEFYTSEEEDKYGWGHRYLWIHAEEFGNPEPGAELVQQFLAKFRPDQCWSLTYAETCSRPIVGEFGGGAIFVTADDISWENTYTFVSRKREEFKEQQKGKYGT
jgi:hypothetical protein